MDNQDENIKKPNQTDDRLMDVKEVAIYLKLTPETVRRLVRSGKLPAIKINETYRFKRGMINDYLNRSTLFSQPE